MGTLQFDYWLCARSAYLKNMLQNLNIKQLDKDQRCWKAQSKEQSDWSREKMAEVRYNRGWITTESRLLLTFSEGYQWDLKDLIKSDISIKNATWNCRASWSWKLYLWGEYLTILESCSMSFTNLWPMKFQSYNLLETILGKDPCMPALILFFPGSSLLVTDGSRQNKFLSD